VRPLRKIILRARLVVGLLAAAQSFTSLANSATLASHQVQGSGTLDIQFPISSNFQEIAAQGGNPRPTTGHALIYFPSGFDPAKSWPILVITSTTDVGRTNILDAPAYRDAAMKEGWIVFATDATIQPNADSLQWRLVPLTAGLQFLRSSWPQSAQWPVAFAGFSGGAKRAGIVAAMLASNHGLKIRGCSSPESIPIASVRQLKIIIRPPISLRFRSGSAAEALTPSRRPVWRKAFIIH